MLKIRAVSDLHLEFDDIDITNHKNCDVLILAGDICTAVDLINPRDKATRIFAKRYRNFFKRISNQYPHIIYVAGNHEFYHGYWFKTIDILRNESARYPNIYFLERDTKIINNVIFVGGSLWTDLNREDPLTMHAVKDLMNDFSTIRNELADSVHLKPIDTVDRHQKTLGYIKQVVAEKYDKKFVVVSHHAPSYMSINEQYRKDYLMNGAYYSNLSDFILEHPQIKLWVHGHTHHVADYMIGTTRVVCNPRGYSHIDQTGWDQRIIMEV